MAYQIATYILVNIAIFAATPHIILMSVSPDSYFFQGSLSPKSARNIVDDALVGMDDGELFLEHTESESLVFDDGRFHECGYPS